MVPPLSRGSITNIETGKQRVLAHTLLSIAAALGVSPSELLEFGSRSDAPKLRTKTGRRTPMADLASELETKMKLSRSEAQALAASLGIDEGPRR